MISQLEMGRIIVPKILISIIDSFVYVYTKQIFLGKQHHYEANRHTPFFTPCRLQAFASSRSSSSQQTVSRFSYPFSHL
jgi:hypothetical protein